MGEVYLAQDLTLERSVALEILPPQLVRNEERLRRFVIEAKSASSLNHPAIVTIHFIYEAVTRRRAFEADSAVDTMHKILYDAPVETQELNPTAPADLRRLVRRCLAKAPDQRLQSMKDLSIELREIADGYDSLSNSQSSGSGASAVGAVSAQAGKRFGWAQAIAGVAVVAALAASAYFGFGRKPVGGGSSGAQAPDMKMSVLMSRADIDTCVLSGDGRYLAYDTTSKDVVLISDF